MIAPNPDARLSLIREKVEAGQRLSFDDGVLLYEHADLFTLGELANLVRERKNGNFAYYNINTHLNPTNVCVYRCTFCAFRADLKSPKGYVMSDEQILHRADEAEKRGAQDGQEGDGADQGAQRDQEGGRTDQGHDPQYPQPARRRHRTDQGRSRRGEPALEAL